MSARKTKEIGSRTKTTTKEKAAVVSSSSVVKRSLVSPEKKAVPGIKLESSKKIVYGEEKEIINAIKMANDNISNLYENIKNSDRKTSNKK